jgi:hypothetical protein
MPGFISRQCDSKGQETGCALLRSRSAGRAAGLVAHGFGSRLTITLCAHRVAFRRSLGCLRHKYLCPKRHPMRFDQMKNPA